MEEKDIKKDLTRRSFIKGAAVAGAAVAATTVLGTTSTEAAQKYTIPKKWDREADVVIVGGGGAGLCAAIEAAGAGVKVLLLEKMPVLGGDTLMSGAAIGVAGTSIQKKSGVEDSPGKFFQDYLALGKKENGFIKRDTKVLKAYCDHGGELVEWLISHDVPFLDKVQLSKGFPRRHYVAPGYRKGSPVLIDKLKKAAEEKGVKFLLRTKLTALLTDPSDQCFQKRVIGVVAEDPKGKIINLKASRGVVLSTGGFSMGKDLIKRYYPYLETVRSMGNPGNTGDGIKAAQDIGANMIDEHMDYGVETIFASTKKGVTGGIAVDSTSLIIVTKEGKRFINEMGGYSPACKKMIGSGYRIGYWVFDDAARKKYEIFFKPFMDSDALQISTSLEELASKTGINSSALAETIRNYNQDVEKGVDREFGRKRLLEKIEVAPFYACEVEPAFYVTYGGLEINPSSQALNEIGKPIPSLYAAGEVCGTVGPQANCPYWGGLPQCMIFGRIAGKNAAAEKSWG